MSHQLILLDGSAFLFRAYFSTLSQNLTNDDGFPTGAMFGVINAIKNLQRKYPNAKMIAIFDAKGKNHRHIFIQNTKLTENPLTKSWLCKSSRCTRLSVPWVFTLCAYLE